MSVLICKPLTALELGFLTCLLRTAQESAWSRRDDDRQAIAPYLKQLTRCLLGVRSGFDAELWSLFRRLRAATNRGHRRAVQARDALLADFTDEFGDPGEAARREEQAQDWAALATFAYRCVEADPEAVAWWRLGFGIASLVYCPDTAKTGIARFAHAGEGLREEVERLPEPDRSWVAGVIPHEADQTTDGKLRLLQAYHTLRDSLPERDRLRCRSSVERLFRPVSEDFSRCWWHVTGDLAFDETERVVARRLYEDMRRGGHGVKSRELLAGTLRATQARLDAVFLHGRGDQRWHHPAWLEGLIENVYGGRYRLNLRGRKRTRKYTHPPASSD